MNRRLLILMAMLVSIWSAAVAERVVTDSVLINFRQSKVYLDTHYMDNESALSHAEQMIELYSNPDSNLVLTRVTVVGGASPEGSVKFNEWLSRQRATRIFEYIEKRFDLPDSLTTFTFLGRDWGGLRQMVVDDEAVPYRDEVLELIDDIIAGNAGGEKESSENLLRLKRLRQGEPYLYMYYHLFPTLRASRLVLTFEDPRKRIRADISEPPELPHFDVELPELNVKPMPAPEPPKPDKPFYMALKTNMPLDALAVPNIGAEFYLGKNMSVAVNWMYAWWHSDRTHHYWRLYGGDIALRWWFGHKAHVKPLTGHHIGIYGGTFTYDFERGGTGYLGCLPGKWLWARPNWQAGVEYGFSLPIARRWNIDFTVGVGYMWGEYRKYDPLESCYVWKSTHRLRYFGPTKAEISLVWLIGHGNKNKRWLKGGEL